MRHLIKIILLVACFSSLALLADNSNMMERIKTLKKIKMIDYLDLPEEKAEKFLVKYNSYQNKIDDKTKELDNAALELEKLIADGKTAEFKANVDKIERLQNEINQLNTEMNTNLKTMLSEKEYAKLVVFERKFPIELRKNLMRLKNRNK